MADTSLRARLRRLFSTNVVVRNIGGRQLKVVDTSRSQYLPQRGLIDRYQKCIQLVEVLDYLGIQITS